MKFFIFLSISILELFSSQIVIKFSHVTSKESAKGRAADFFAKRVKELSHGNIEVVVYANSKFSNDTDAIKKIKDGTLQMAAPSISKLVESNPSLSFFDKMFKFKNLKELRELTDSKDGYELLRSLDSDYVGLDYWDNGFRQITTSNKPILSVKDFEDLKIRIMNSSSIISQYSKLKAIPIITPFKIVKNMLKFNIIEAQENTFSNIYLSGVYKYQKYLIVSNHAYLGYIVIINKKFWKSLSKAQKEIIKKALRETTIKQRAWADEINKYSFEKLKEYAKKTGQLKILHINSKLKKEILSAINTSY